MAETTGISWTDSTRNFWTGCTKIGPGCDSCYAEAKDQRFYQGAHWGPGAPRLPHFNGAARDLRRWNKKAEAEIAAGTRKRWTVFVDSQSDLFDAEVPQAWREIAFALMRECKSLTFIAVTKRIGNTKHMLPKDWGAGYANVWLLATIVNQEEADRDLPKLLATPAVLHGVSYEPALGPVDWSEWLAANELHAIDGGPKIDWLIVGGESDQPGHPARPFDIGWARDTVAQCKAAGVPVFVKQLGSNAQGLIGDAPPGRSRYTQDKAGADPSEWSEDLRVQEHPL